MSDAPDDRLSAIFTLTETSYIDTAWFASDDGMDFLAMVFQDAPGQPWRMTARFRYYATTGAARQDAWDGKDEKRVTRAIAKTDSDADREKLLAGMARVMTEMICEGLRVTKMTVHGNSDAYLALIKNQPWVHVRTDY
jgi:hypothetical protein